MGSGTQDCLGSRHSSVAEVEWNSVGILKAAFPGSLQEDALEMAFPSCRAASLNKM